MGEAPPVEDSSEGSVDEESSNKLKTPIPPRTTQVNKMMKLSRMKLKVTMKKVKVSSHDTTC